MKRHLTAVATASALLALAGCGSDEPAADTTTSSTSAAVDTSAAPADVHWETWRGASLPTSSTDGPREVAGDVATGSTPTPQGAVLAAAQGITRLRLAPDNSWPDVVNAVAAPGVGRDTYAINRAQVSITDPAPDGTEARLQGFEVTDFTDARAAVRLAVERPDGALVATTHTLVWSGDDWKLLLPAPEDIPSPETLTATTGFTDFAAAS
jgi:predicted small lipoprotein YifL